MHVTAVYLQIRTEHINVLDGENAESPNAISGGTCSCHCLPNPLFKLFFLRLFALTALPNLHHFLIRAPSFRFDAP